MLREKAARLRQRRERGRWRGFFGRVWLPFHDRSTALSSAQPRPGRQPDQRDRQRLRLRGSLRAAGRRARSARRPAGRDHDERQLEKHLACVGGRARPRPYDYSSARAQRWPGQGYGGDRTAGAERINRPHPRGAQVHAPRDLWLGRRPPAQDLVGGNSSLFYEQAANRFVKPLEVNWLREVLGKTGRTRFSDVVLHAETA